MEIQAGNMWLLVLISRKVMDIECNGKFKIEVVPDTK